MSYITTFTGKHFDPTEPDLNLIDIKDIAHALSLICRANGHCKIFYSVAQHSLTCAKEAMARGLSQRLALACLLHDASEAYLSDVTRPVKHMLTEYLEVEDRLQNLIWTAFMESEPTDEEKSQIFEIDDQILSMEFHQLMPEQWIDGYENLKRKYICEFQNPVDVEREFIAMASELTGESEDSESWDIPYTSHEEVISNRRDETTDDDNLAWKKVKEEHIVRDEWIDFRKVAYQFPDGKVFSPYYNYSRKSYVVVLATDTDGNVLCVKQYRHGIGKVTTEFPAGGIETHGEAEYITAGDKHVEPESAFDAAVRELREETGYESDDWKHLITIPSDATLADNYAYVYVARNCRKVGGVDLDGTEFLNVVLHTPSEIDEMIASENFDQAIHVMAWALAKGL